MFSNGIFLISEFLWWRGHINIDTDNLQKAKLILRSRMEKRQLFTGFPLPIVGNFADY